ncbi:MAG: hypothetical protein M3Y89_15050 [Actinomycetota bacterium]|nr:hypothetical protein [Actinomycetota bacterium]
MRVAVGEHQAAPTGARSGPPRHRLLPVPEDPTAAVNISKPLRREIALKALAAIRSMNALGIVTCQTKGTDPAHAYARLIAAVDAELEQREAWAIVAIDADPGNRPPYLHRAHRDLNIHSRRIIEDGIAMPAHSSQLIQMADLIAHCAYQSHRRKPARQFM